MNIGLACGGTGGHLMPGLATASVLRSRGHHVVLWLAGKDVEGEAVKGWGGDVLTIPAEGLPHAFSVRALSVGWRLARATRDCVRLMRERRPDVLLAMGSYASVGPVCAALRLHVPVVLHEANVLPGRAISLFSRWASSVAASFEETRYYLRRTNLVVTGMPLRSDLSVGQNGQGEVVLDRNLFTLLVMGGSRGAKALNELVPKVVCDLHAKEKGIQVIHLAGLADEARLREQYAQAGVPALVFGFTGEMAPIYATTDLAVCRAGASTCAELCAFGVPALLVPYPHAAKDHQMANARALEKAGAVDVVSESDLNDVWLADYLRECLRVPSRLARMSAASKKRAIRHGAEALADVVEKAARTPIQVEG